MHTLYMAKELIKNYYWGNKWRTEGLRKVSLYDSIHYMKVSVVDMEEEAITETENSGTAKRKNINIYYKS